MAGRLLEDDASLDQVRAKSFWPPKPKSEPQITSPTRNPGPNPTRPWGDVIARTFKLKG